MAASALLTAASCSGVGLHRRNAATTLTLATTTPVTTAGARWFLCQILFTALLRWSRLYSGRARTKDSDTQLPVALCSCDRDRVSCLRNVRSTADLRILPALDGAAGRWPRMLRIRSCLCRPWTGLAWRADPGLAERLGGGIARGAALVAGLTILSRVLGLVRTLVFSQTVGATCLGTAYVTANQVPNLLYELILGGALTSAMIPVLARSAERAPHDPAEKERVANITSALLTWSVIIVVPLVLVIMAAAGPIASLLNPVNPNAHCVRADMVAVTGNMLRVFAPQALFYGLSVVLYGLLQSYRRFAAPSIGPGISSLVLIVLLCRLRAIEQRTSTGPAPVAAELVLAVGTTLGIAALVVVAIPPTWRLHLRLRPALRFPPGVARRAGGLALVGVVELIAIDVANVVAIALANGRGRPARSSYSTIPRRSSTPSPPSWPCPSWSARSP